MLSSGDILDEQGQDAEIRILREKNVNDNKQAQFALDVGVLTCIFISAMHVIGHLSSPTPIFAILAIFQLALLPFSLTPGWIPFLPTLSPNNHLYSTSIQITISICAIYLRWYHGASGPGGGGAGSMGDIELNEVARWAMPALVVGAIDMQRRSERTSEEKIRLLERMKYDLKGA
ncbi:hypothetical protein I316_07063 [Kwoniella heveanensis BCC8398]|uniref:Uncharacterized protein n=1 Tax=Kwoniella heveanensis BCC8398 TaxID=1296120 RepID=A0A1B9GJW0_9TREE|nr:hypothetical protein I316_07063 [Kwoniella heveanensis BCC8398]